MGEPPPRAIVLLSGGLDSATTLAIAKHSGFDCHALSFAYGQRHHHELRAAHQVANTLGAVELRLMTIDLRAFGGSALTADIDVPKVRPAVDASGHSNEIPITYVPARNTIFLSFALAFAEVINADDIFIGVNAVDYSGYPDCRPEYIAAFQHMAQLATRRGVEGHSITIHTPLINLTKAQIIQRGMQLGVDYAITLSCYDPMEKASGILQPCGHCDSCVLRAAGFEQAGFADPALMQST